MSNKWNDWFLENLQDRMGEVVTEHPDIVTQGNIKQFEQFIAHGALTDAEDIVLRLEGLERVYTDDGLIDQSEPFDMGGAPIKKIEVKKSPSRKYNVVVRYE